MLNRCRTVAPCQRRIPERPQRGWITRRSLTLASLFIVCAAVPGLCQDEAAKSLQFIRHFEQKIRPALSEHCIQCHGEKKQEGGLRLDSREALLAGGDSGEAFSSDTPHASLLLEALRYDGYEMPPSGPLPDSTIADFETWFANGAVWPESAEPLRANSVISEEDRQWWAFQPLEVVEPATEPDDWCRNEIDQFVVFKMRSSEVTPAPEASPEVLVRRIYFDLLGLPPTPEEVAAFTADPSADAWSKLIDQLLDDSRYGEHWARFWLDLVRYAESDGWNQDAYRPNIYRYRDYVVRAFNNDKPYPDFVLEQLAGDEQQADSPEDLVATGFLRLGIYEYNQHDARGHWNDIMNEMTDVVGDVFLGMSMACARCHDHKFDPILQDDYFKLRAYLEPISWRDDLVAATEEEKLDYEKKLAAWKTASESVQSKIDALLEPYYTRKWESTVDKFPLDIQACFHMPIAERTSWQHQMAYLVSRQFLEEAGGPLKDMTKEDKATHEELKKQLAEYNALKPAPLPEIMAATDFSGIASPTVVQDAPDRRSVLPGSPEVIVPKATKPSPLANKSTGRRTALANWIGSKDNALTSRVIVNRIWQRHFGKGIVETTSDFGTQGSECTHPELLDWLTNQFIQDGWSFKSLHRRILLSSAWKQSSVHPNAQELQRVDPLESLLWRAPVRRLQAEQIRDAMLYVSGELDLSQGGPSADEKSQRRSLYVKSFRNKNDSFLHGFDMANGLKSVPVRDNTTTPLQALLLINGNYALERAKALGKRLTDSSDDPEQLIQRCFELVWNRGPTVEEYEQASEFLGIQVGEETRFPDQESINDFCHVLLNSNQFLYVK
ncbi:MAG: PSD1 and planctomycete cytochrome C domain-containing protein [Planctomycetota bacterium]